MSAIESRSPTAASSAAERTVIEQRDETVLLEWTIHLIKQDPKRFWGVLFAVALAAALGFLLFFSPLLAAVGAILLLTACAEYVLPIRCQLTTERAMVSYGLARLDIRWENVKRILEGPDAFRLSPFAKESRLDGIRGVTLRWMTIGEVADRDSVYRIVRERVKEARTSAEDDQGD